jgi:hypothetical protein
MNEAKAVEVSENSKLGGMSTTYAGIASCPASCPFLKTRACYGMSGPIGWLWSKIKGKGTPAEIARAEAKLIDSLSGERDLRVHTLGDSRTDLAAKIVSQAAERFMKRGGARFPDRLAFAFTHAWRKVKRASWGKVSIIASCETTEAVHAAKKRGYATALVIPTHQTDKTFELDGLKIVPCPEQTGRAESCAKCRLCLNDKKLEAAGITIAFQTHGPSIKAKAMLAKLSAAI